MKLLAIDIGNTRLKWGLYTKTAIGAPPIAQGAVFLERIEDLSEKDWVNLPEPTHMIGSCVASPAAQKAVDEQLEIWPQIEPHWVKVKEKQCGVTNGYEHPARLGVDRWMALIGARQHLLTKGRSTPAIVVMIGTAVTADALDQDGNFLGGMIMPGHGIMFNALQKGTAGLHVPSGEVVEFPRNTSDALTTGGTYAIVGAIERMAMNLKAHTSQEPQIILTGGAAWKVAPALTHPYVLSESLIFDGILAVAQELWF